MHSGEEAVLVVPRVLVNKISRVVGAIGNPADRVLVLPELLVESVAGVQVV